MSYPLSVYTYVISYLLCIYHVLSSVGLCQVRLCHYLVILSYIYEVYRRKSYLKELYLVTFQVALPKPKVVIIATILSSQVSHPLYLHLLLYKYRF